MQYLFEDSTQRNVREYYPGKRLLNQTTYWVWNKVLVHSLSKLAHLSSQEATSFCSSLMFRLFFLAYLRVEDIFFSGFFSSLISPCPTLCENRNAKRCSVTREITRDFWCACSSLLLLTLYKRLSFSHVMVERCIATEIADVIKDASVIAVSRR